MSTPNHLGSRSNLRVCSNEVSSDIEQVTELFVRALDRKLEQAERDTNKRSVILDAHDYAQRITLAIIMLVTYKQQNIVDFDATEDPWVKGFKQAETQVLSPAYALCRAFPIFRPIITWASQFHRQN